MIDEFNEDLGLLSVLGKSIYDGLSLYNSEIERCDYLNACYGKNHRSNIQRAIVEYQLFKLGKANMSGISSQEDYTSKQTSYFLKLLYNEKIALTTFRLRHRTQFPKEANYRGNYAKSNQLYLLPETEPVPIIPDGIKYGIICFGIDNEGMFAYIGYPDDENKRWVNVTRLEDYFTDFLEPENITEEVLPKLRISQESINGTS